MRIFRINVNPTLAGLFAVLVWGVALPAVRMAEDLIGMPATVGAIFASTGIMGLLLQKIRGLPVIPPREVLRNPYFYGRWLFFVMHEGLLLVGISLVQKKHMPFIILLNYLWPTAVIICSVLLAGVKVERWPAFVAGLSIVVASLAIEIVGPQGFSPDLFAHPADCFAYAIVFIGALSWGLYSALTRRAGAATGGGGVITVFQITLGFMLPVSLLPGMATWSHMGMTPALLLGFYCFLQFLAYLGWDRGMQSGNVVALSLCADFIPWISLLSARLMLGVDVGGRAALSAVSLVAGAIIARSGTLQKQKKPLQSDQPEI